MSAIRKHITPLQQELLVEAMEVDRELFTKRSNTVQGKETYRKKWEKLTEHLNSVEAGARKTTVEWQKAWVTLKGNVKSKASAVASHARGTGGGPPGKKLTELEERIVSLLGDDLVCGLPINEAGFGPVYDDGAGVSPFVVPSAKPTQIVAEGAVDQWLRNVHVKFEEDAGQGSSRSILRTFTPIPVVIGRAAKRVAIAESQTPTSNLSSSSSTPVTSRGSTPVTSRGSTPTGIPDKDEPLAKKMRSKVADERRAAMATFTNLMVRQAQAMEAVAASLQTLIPICERIATSVENLNEVAIPDE